MPPASGCGPRGSSHLPSTQGRTARWRDELCEAFKLSLAHARAKGLSYFQKFRFKDTKDWLLCLRDERGVRSPRAGVWRREVGSTCSR